MKKSDIILQRCSMNIRELYEDAGLTTEEISAIPLFIEGEGEFFESKAYEKLYEYFAFESCEMPYGTAKARDGDPEEWIMDKLESLGAGGTR